MCCSCHISRSIASSSSASISRSLHGASVSSGINSSINLAGHRRSRPSRPSRRQRRPPCHRLRRSRRSCWRCDHSRRAAHHSLSPSPRPRRSHHSRWRRDRSRRAAHHRHGFRLLNCRGRGGRDKISRGAAGHVLHHRPRNVRVRQRDVRGQRRRRRRLEAGAASGVPRGHDRVNAQVGQESQARLGHQAQLEGPRA